MASPKELCTQTPDGVRLRALAFGAPQGPLVLLLHGGGQTQHAWHLTAKALAERGYYAVCPDARGHGESDWDPHGNYRLSDFRDDVGHWVVELGHRPAALIGASLGGFSSLLFEGELRTARSRALILVDITPTIQPLGVKRIVDFMTARPDGFGTLEEASDAIAEYLPHRKRPSDLSGLAKNLRQGDDGRFRWHWDPRFITGRSTDNHAVHGAVPEQRLVDAAMTLQVPTLLVRGKLSDLVSLEDVERLRTYVPHAEFVDVSEAGHMVAGDSNDPFTEAVTEFLRRHVPLDRD